MNVGAPLNVSSLPGLTNGKELAGLGVKRFSFGNALFDKAIELLERVTARIVELSDTSHLYGKKNLKGCAEYNGCCYKSFF